MPTEEGVFPKVGNDPIYYSEVNRFNNSNILALNIGSNIYAGSSSDFIKTGSVVIPANTILFSNAILTTAFKTVHSIDNTYREYRIGISGTTGNGVIYLGSGWGGAGGTALDGLVITWVGPNTGISQGWYTMNYAGGTTTNYMKYGPTLNLGSEFELSTQIKVDNGSARFTNLLITKQVGGSY